MYSLSLQQLLFNMVAGLLLAGVLGWTVAWTAFILGDEGPAQDGRRTANPIPHLGVLGFLGFLVFAIGWVRPLDVRPETFKRGRWMAVVVALSGPVSLLLLAFISMRLETAALATLTGEAAFAASAFLDAVAASCIGTAIVNLLPVPPFAGGIVLRIFAFDTATTLERHSGWVGLTILAGLWTGVLREPINFAVRAIETVLAM